MRIGVPNTFRTAAAVSALLILTAVSPLGCQNPSSFSPPPTSPPVQDGLAALAQDAFIEDGILALPSPVLASYERFEENARIATTQGDAFVRAGHQPSWGGALENLVLEDGDEILTGEDGGIGVEFPGGVFLDLHQESQARIKRAGRGPRIELLHGSFYVVLLEEPEAYEPVEVAWEHGSVILDQRGSYRIDLEPGGLARVSVQRGGARVKAGGVERFLTAGEAVTIDPGGFEDRKVAYSSEDYDPFDRVVIGRYASLQGYQPPAFFPRRLVGWHQLARYGFWIFVPRWNSYGWRPRDITHAWRPYRDGHWCHTRQGWTWVPREPWGYTTSHYGRWDYLQAHGWVWKPDRGYHPGRVRWIRSGSIVGWAPIGPDGELVVPPRGPHGHQSSPFLFASANDLAAGRPVRPWGSKRPHWKDRWVMGDGKILQPGWGAKRKGFKTRKEHEKILARAAAKAEAAARKGAAKRERSTRRDAKADWRHQQVQRQAEGERERQAWRDEQARRQAEAKRQEQTRRQEQAQRQEAKRQEQARFQAEEKRERQAWRQEQTRRQAEAKRQEQARRQEQAQRQEAKRQEQARRQEGARQQARAQRQEAKRQERARRQEAKGQARARR